MCKKQSNTPYLLKHSQYTINLILYAISRKILPCDAIFGIFMISATRRDAISEIIPALLWLYKSSLASFNGTTVFSPTANEYIRLEHFFLIFDYADNDIMRVYDGELYDWNTSAMSVQNQTKLRQH